jgi:hypothetical protein
MLLDAESVIQHQLAKNVLHSTTLLVIMLVLQFLMPQTFADLPLVQQMPLSLEES